MRKRKQELGRGFYFAEQQHVPGHVIVHAVGMAPAPLYKVWLEQGPEDVSPPTHYLYWLPPGDIQPQVLAPFYAFADFWAKEAVDTVKVLDADGWHDVEVQRAPE
jgi:hypothetical protein